MLDGFTPVVGGGKEGQYVWSKEPYTITEGRAISGYYGAVTRAPGEILYYADEFGFDEATSTFYLVDAQSVIASQNVGFDLTGKYIARAITGNRFYDGLTMAIGKAAEAITIYEFYSTFYGAKAHPLIVNVEAKRHIVDDDGTKYPNDGYKNGFKYVKLT